MENMLLLAIIGVGICLIQLNLFYGQWRSRQRALTREKVFMLQHQGIKAEICEDCTGEGGMGIFHSECPQCEGLGFWVTTDQPTGAGQTSPARDQKEQLSLPV